MKYHFAKGLRPALAQLMDEEHRKAHDRFNQALECRIRAELWRLRTHRMNVVRVTEGQQIVQLSGNVWRLAEKTWLELLLPRGPRPLP